MSMKSYPFDSEITGYEADGSPIYDRAADSAVLANWMKHYFSDGVFMEQASQTPGFQVLADSGMNVIVSAGACEIQGRFAYDENVNALTIPAADTTYDRIDTVALRLNLENDVRNIQLVVIPGTPASSPVAPALTRNLSVYDLGIANIRVAKNSANIAQSAITDTRLDTDRCGVVCVPMQVMDSKELYIQIQNDLESFRKEYEDSFESWSETQRASFDAWFSNVQLTLDEEIAGNLYNLIAKDAFQTYSHGKTGNVHALTLSGGAHVNIKFRATARFDAGDTFTLNGEAVNALMPDGNALSDGYFVEGAICVGFYCEEDNTIYFVGGGATNTLVTISLSTYGGGDGNVTGCTVTVTNTEDDAIIEQFVYDGQPRVVLVPVATKYRVSVSELAQHVKPADVVYTATANIPRSINMAYKYGTRYGFRRSKSNSHASDRITYLYNAVDMTPMTVNLSTGTPDYGSWQEFVDEVCRPVMLKYDGTVDYELDHNDQTKRADNGEASDVANTAYEGNAMVEFSGFKWVKRYEDSSYEYVIFSNVQFDSDYHAYAHTNANGVIQDAFYWGMFKGVYTTSKLRSIGTGSVMVEQTRATEISRAQANGSGTDQTKNGYYTIFKSGWDYIADLLTLLSKSDNSQAVFGAGRSLSSNSAGIGVGSLKAKPAFCGYSNGTSDVKVLYIEGAWGNYWEGMAGMILDGSNGIKIKMHGPYNMTGSGYHATGVVPSGTSGGYVNTHSCYDEAGYVPKTASGSETTYMCDGLWFNTSQVDYALVGGWWNSAGRCGSRCVDLADLASSAAAAIGSRLSFVPV